MLMFNVHFQHQYRSRNQNWRRYSWNSHHVTYFDDENASSQCQKVTWSKLTNTKHQFWSCRASAWKCSLKLLTFWRHCSRALLSLRSLLSPFFLFFVVVPCGRYVILNFKCIYYFVIYNCLNIYKINNYEYYYIISCEKNRWL